MNNKIVMAVVAVAILAAIVAGVHYSAPSTDQGQHAGALMPNSASPYECIGGVCDWKVAALCGQPSGTIASSTMFAIPNPWNATSTFSALTVQGLNGATTTDFLIGTSTTPAPAGTAVATSSVGANLVGMYKISAGASFFTTAGVTIGPGTGYTAPSGGTYPTSVGSVVVGPGEYVLGFATSTNPSGNGGLLGSSIQSCNYTGVFRRGF